MRAMIFAAGMGTRLKPLTDIMPKALVPVCGKPLLKWQIDMLMGAGISRITVNVHHKAEQIIDYLQANKNFGCDIRISDERDMLLETGGGLRKAMTTYPTDEPTIALNADILSTNILQDLMSAYDNQLALLVVSQRKTQRYLAFDEKLNLRGWTNVATGEVRPAGQDLSQTQLLAFSGMQIVSPQIVSYMNDIEKDKFSLIDLYMGIIDKGGIIPAYIPSDYQMMDVGKTEQLGEVEQWATQWLK
ncbi:MAG: nucleotidyltransferase family protein [Paludibacteraceae bacterium]|nr:nucleotidyltransferase family protein [Paludibacteraceae bacterium]